MRRRATQRVGGQEHLVLGAAGQPRPVARHALDRPGVPRLAAIDLANTALFSSADEGSFPSGLLPSASVVTGEGSAVVDGRLADVYAQLTSTEGFAVSDSELETLDAEIELDGPDWELGLRLELAADCERATQVRLAG